MSRLISRSEGWEKVHTAFSSINFAAFDYNTVKQSLLDYIKLHFPETFNDYIESSEMVAIVESFAYVAELLAYRIDVVGHENFITTAQRRDSILRLAKLVSYTPSRPKPARGLVKITSVQTTEAVTDASGNSLSGRTIRWNDASNASWKEQFIAVMNRAMEQTFGTVSITDRFQSQDVMYELYPLRTNDNVLPFTAVVHDKSIKMEVVPVERSELSVGNSQSGIRERRPQSGTAFTILYGSDGLGDSSNSTGFFAYVKQGTLHRFTTDFDGITPNQTYQIPLPQINDTDVWVNNIDESGQVLIQSPLRPNHRQRLIFGKYGEWQPVDSVKLQNVVFNTNKYRNKYEVETVEGDSVRLLFGDGEFTDIPTGTFEIWARTSLNEDVVVPQSAVVDKELSFTYKDRHGQTQTFSFTVSLTRSLTNASAAESTEHIRETAPAVYYTQHRMVNGVDYNTFMRQDPSIVKLRSINRTFAGDSKYITWHDSSNTYENVKMFGDDGALYLRKVEDEYKTKKVDVDVLVEVHIRPMLYSPDVMVRLLSEGVEYGRIKRVLSYEEKQRIIQALSANDRPYDADLYFNRVTGEWHAHSHGQRNGMEKNLEIFQTSPDFINYPLVEIRRDDLEIDEYHIASYGSRLIFESQEMMFWETNEARRVLDYDTRHTVGDSIFIMSANANASRTGLLGKDVELSIDRQEVIDVGENRGMADIHRVAVGVDKMDVGFDLTSIDQSSTLSHIFGPVLNIRVSDLSEQGIYELPIHYITGEGDISVFINEERLTDDPQDESDVHYEEIADDYTRAIGKVSRNVRIRNKHRLNPSDVITIKLAEYVYFTRTNNAEEWKMAEPSPENMARFKHFSDLTQTEQSQFAQQWKRYVGRRDLNFKWLHFSPRYHLIDPSPTNIVDVFIITKGYFDRYKQWLDGYVVNEPSRTTPLELRNDYSYMVNNKMISDTVVLRPGQFRLLFGDKSDPSLQGRLKIIKAVNSQLTDNQIKTRVVAAVKKFFNVAMFDFGETFHFTELSAAIHYELPIDISSVVLTPTYASSRFGDLLQVHAREDEILYPDIGVEDIDIVDGYTPMNLRQR